MKRKKKEEKGRERKRKEEKGRERKPHRSERIARDVERDNFGCVEANENPHFMD